MVGIFRGNLVMVSYRRLPGSPSYSEHLLTFLNFQVCLSASSTYAIAGVLNTRIRPWKPPDESGQTTVTIQRDLHLTQTDIATANILALTAT